MESEKCDPCGSSVTTVQLSWEQIHWWSPPTSPKIQSDLEKQATFHGPLAVGKRDLWLASAKDQQYPTVVPALRNKNALWPAPDTGRIGARLLRWRKSKEPWALTRRILIVCIHGLAFAGKMVGSRENPSLVLIPLCSNLQPGILSTWGYLFLYYFIPRRWGRCAQFSSGTEIGWDMHIFGDESKNVHHDLLLFIGSVLSS